MRRLIALYLIAGLLLSGIMPAAIAAGIEGLACKKSGQSISKNGLTYICTKSGKKMIWLAKSKNNKENLSPNQQKTTFTPWSSTASGEEISNAAQANFREWVKVQKKENLTHNLVAQEGVPTTRLKNFTLVDTLGTQLFSKYFSIKTTTVLGTSEDWVLKNLNANGEKYEKCDYNSGNPGLIYCHNGYQSQGYIIQTDESFQPKNVGRDGSSLLAHEYFHLVQAAMSDTAKQQTTIDGTPRSKKLFPVWLVEGSANFVGFSVATLALGSTYGESRQAMFTYAKPGPSLNANTLQDYEIRNGPGNDSPTYPYIPGQVASEYIVASVGFQKFLDIWLNYKTSRDFEASFKQAIGISKTEFYSKFEKVRTNLGLPPVSWKLNCLTNTPLDQYPANPEPCFLDKTDSRETSGQNSNSSNQKPPPVDKNSNVENLGCSSGEPAFTNSFGTFTCTTLPNGNNLWKRSS